MYVRRRYYKNTTTGTIIQSSNITTINTSFCGGSPPTLSNYDGALVCASGVQAASGLLQVEG